MREREREPAIRGGEKRKWCEKEREWGAQWSFFTRACRREREREREALGGRTEEEEASVTREEKIPRGMYIYIW